MIWQVSWTRRAERDVEGTDGVTRQRIDLTLNRLAQTGEGDLIKLQGYDETWQLRVGDWRVLPRSIAYRA